jgi:hypothetical protein
MRALSMAATGLVACCAPALAQCPALDPSFGDPTLNGTVRASVVFDDGNGPKLYAGGDFTGSEVATVRHIARFGAQWNELGSGGANASVLALCVFDDGSGPALYAGGAFDVIGGTSASHVARWDGQGWSPLSGGTDGAVRALIVHDDGSGPALFAGGDFTHAGGNAASHVARWDGSGWTALAQGASGAVDAFARFDDGNGTALYAGGLFLSAGSVPARNIARWGGTSWQILGNGTNGRVRALAVHAGALHAAGDFTTAGGLPASRVARWSGGAWSALGGGFDQSVHSLTVLDDGSGPALCAGGWFAHSGTTDVPAVARFGANAWSAVGEGLAGQVETLCVDTTNGPPRLFAGGACTLLTDGGTLGTARFDGVRWRPLANGVTPNYALKVVAADHGAGPAVFIGGLFEQVGGLLSNGIAEWSGGAWSQVGTGATLGQWMLSFTTFDWGAGPRLIAGGGYTSIGGVAANSVASYDGTSWLPFGVGLNGNAYSLGVFDDGSGAALYAGGTFTASGGTQARYIARWNGSAWVEVGGGLTAPIGSGFANVRAMTVYDDGQGPALYIAGFFRRAGALDAMNIARWNGTSWSALGSGLTSPAPFSQQINALAVFDDGGGPQLYAGGYVHDAGGVPVLNLARWNGTAWSAVGAGSATGVNGLAVFDDGTGQGSALYASAPDRILRWNGTSLDTVALDSTLPNDDVQSLAALPASASAPAELWAVGTFNSLGGVASVSVARLVACDGVGLVYCSGDGSGTACPCGNSGAPGNGCASSFNAAGGHLGARGNPSVSSDSIRLEASGLSSSVVTFFQGTQQVGGGAGAVFGDGLRCAGGTTIRLAAVLAAAGAAQYPGPTDPSVSLRGRVPGTGGRRTYQVWYRNAVSFCTPATFTFTNGLELAWQP